MKVWGVTGYLHSLKVSPHKNTYELYREKKKNSNLRVEKPGRYHFKQVQITSSVSTSAASDRTHWKECIIISAVFPTIPQNNQNLNTRKRQTNPNWGTCYKITGLYSSQMSMSQNKGWRTIPDWRGWKRNDNWMQRMIQDVLVLCVTVWRQPETHE